MVEHIFHFTIGPVQGFVAQARRTRDLWAGSFLLSWLAGQAMAEVLEKNGIISFPDVGTIENPQDPMLKVILRGSGHPFVGTIPNRFKAKVPEIFDPESVTKRVWEKWRALAECVYREFVLKVAADYGHGTESIWKRQINSFWEIAWMLGPDPGDKSDDQWLDIRKNWRNHWPEPESGQQCLIMSDFQELSGYSQISNRNKQKQFWQAMQNTAPDGCLDIRDNERLCSIALVKRLFPRLGKDNLISKIGWVPGANADSAGNWPSTTYMAVAPWLSQIASDPQKITSLKEYVVSVHDTVNQSGRNYFKKLASEQSTKLTMLAPLRDEQVAKKTLDSLDGDLLHHHALTNYRTTYLSDLPISPAGKDPEPGKRKVLQEKLSALYKKTGKPRSYYVLLLMDGDRLGQMLRYEDQRAVSRALLSFTGMVKDCINLPQYSGVTIYAGGDDVLALLPLGNAIACAQKLYSLFTECFTAESISATASTAVIYAHHQVPLRTVLAEAHHQLESVAKEINGRDSLALAVLKPSGVTASWVSCWRYGTSEPVAGMQQLVGKLAKESIARSFFYKLRDRYGFFSDDLPENIQLNKLLVAELMQSRDKTISLSEAEKVINVLLQACHTIKRDHAGNYKKLQTLSLDGGYIARFLTQKED